MTSYDGLLLHQGVKNNVFYGPRNKNRQGTFTFCDKKDKKFQL